MAADTGPESSGGTATLLLVSESGSPGWSALEGELFDSPSGESRVLVVTYRPPKRWHRQWDRDGMEGVTDLGVIAVGETLRSTRTQSSTTGSDSEVTPVLSAVSDPTDVADLGITIDMYLDEWVDRDAETIVCVDSLTALLANADAQTVFRFVQLLVGRARGLGARLLVRCDPTAHSEETLRTFTPLFDRVIEADEEVSADPPPPLDETLGLLKSETRRHAVRILAEDDAPIDVETLATRIAAREDGIPPSAVSSDRRDRLHISLTQMHLPKLDELRVVASDGEAVRPARHFAHVLAHLEAIDGVSGSGGERR